MLFARILGTFVRDGSLRIIGPTGRASDIGDGSPPFVIFRVTRRAAWSLARNPPLALGETYMDGTLTFERGTMVDLLGILARNYRHAGNSRWLTWLSWLASWLKQHNPAAAARRNVAHHYDLSGALYDLFLDADKQYSCAYFSEPGQSLDAAQAAKKIHIAAKLYLDRPNLKVLDIGSGWGGMALHLASAAGAEVTGVTLSEEQFAMSVQRAERAGLASRAQFRLQDYRTLGEQYDRIVSVGMFEHVGKRNYREFFAKLRDLLTEDGVALIHTIGYTDAPGAINPFIRKHIFPGADLPSLSELMAVVEQSGLIVTDVEVLRLHYAEALKHWRERFMAKRDKAVRLYDERFCRMWEFYLALCEVGFRYRTTVIFQIQLTRELETLPLTRDYMLDAERAAMRTEPSRAA